jgi:sodium transport system permease protein
MNFSDVGVVLRKELRETLRDRRTLAVMLLFPLVVYPMVSLLMAEVMTSKQAADEARTSTVAVVTIETGVDAAAVTALRANLRGKDAHIQFVEGVEPATVADIVAGRLDALVELAAPSRAAPSQAVRIYYDETRDPSEKAHARVETALAAVLPPGCTHSYNVASSNIAPKAKVGGYVLSKILPLIVIVMTMLGAFYPAIDITAGERERGTLETLLSSPVRRFDLMTGKVLAVAVLAALTGILNIASMSLTVAEAARLAGGGSQALTIPWARAAATLLTVVPAAFLFAAVMVAIGAMARGFKEAQSLLTPVYLLCFTPSLIATVADFQLGGLTLLVPGTNLTLLARDLMLGQATIGHAVVVVGSTLLFGAMALSFAARLYDSERLLSAPDADLIGLATWLRHLVQAAPLSGTQGPRASQDPRSSHHSQGSPDSQNSQDPRNSRDSESHAIALFGIAFVLWFFVFTWLQRWRLLPGLMLSQWGGFFGLVFVYARLMRRRLRDVLWLRRPNAWALLGAALLGLSGWVILGVLADRVMPPPPQLVEEMRKLIRPPGGDRPLALSLLALALTPALCEEALFRGPILRGFRHRFSAPGACLLTGVLFGILHGDVWRFIPTSLLGALLSWVALASGSIFPSMLVHFINNAALIVLGYYGLDKTAEKLPARAEIVVFTAAALLFSLGLLAIRRGRGQPSSQPPQTS